MSEIDDLTQFTLTGLESAVRADGTGDLGAEGVRVSVTVTARPEVVHVPSSPPRTVRIRPVKFRIEDGVLVRPAGGSGDVRLVANTGLGITGSLLYDVKFGAGVVGGEQIDFGDQNFTFAAPTSDTSVDMSSVERLAGRTPAGTQLRMIPDRFRLDDDGRMVVSSNGIDISDPLDVTVTGIPADMDDITDATTVGKAVARAASQAAARTAIGASSLVLGTTSSTAKAGDYQPVAANITDATTVGRSVLKSADAAAARNAIETLGLVQAAKNPDLLVTGAVTLDVNDLITSAEVVWPDGTAGTLTITSRDTNNAVLAYKITYGSPVTRTFTQPTITRNANGAATNVPAIVVSGSSGDIDGGSPGGTGSGGDIDGGSPGGTGSGDIDGGTP